MRKAAHDTLCVFCMFFPTYYTLDIFTTARASSSFPSPAAQYSGDGFTCLFNESLPDGHALFPI